MPPSVKRAEHEEAWAVSMAIDPTHNNRATVVPKGKDNLRRPGTAGGTREIKLAATTAKSVYGSPASAGGPKIRLGSAGSRGDGSAGKPGSAAPKAMTTAQFAAELRGEGPGASKQSTGEACEELHRGVQREIWRKDREQDLSGLLTAEAERREGGGEATVAFGEKLLWAETGWTRPGSGGSGGGSGGATGAEGGGGAVREERGTGQAGSLLRLLRDTSAAPAPDEDPSAPRAAWDPSTGHDNEDGDGVGGVRQAAAGTPLQRGRPQSAATARPTGRGGGRGRGRGRGSNSARSWTDRNLERARQRPRTAPRAKKTPTGTPAQQRREVRARIKSLHEEKGEKMQLMLLGPQRVRIRDTSAQMLQSIERTAAVLERAGRGVLQNHELSPKLVSWGDSDWQAPPRKGARRRMHEEDGESSGEVEGGAGAGGGAGDGDPAVWVDGEGQLGEVYRLV